MVGAEDIDPYSICTSHAERNNLTIRTFMRRFTRLSLGFSKKLDNLVAAVALHVAHYDFVQDTTDGRRDRLNHLIRRSELEILGVFAVAAATLCGSNGERPARPQSKTC